VYNLDVGFVDPPEATSSPRETVPAPFECRVEAQDTRMIVERTRAGQRSASPSLFRSRPLGFVNRKMFSFRSNLALFMA
jgi:hypothetical protein